MACVVHEAGMAPEREKDLTAPLRMANFWRTTRFPTAFIFQVPNYRKKGCGNVSSTQRTLRERFWAHDGTARSVSRKRWTRVASRAQSISSYEDSRWAGGSQWTQTTQVVRRDPDCGAIARDFKHATTST